MLILEYESFPDSSVGKEPTCNAADLGWEDPLVKGLAPGWPQLRSRLPFGPRSQASLQKAQGPGVQEMQV